MESLGSAVRLTSEGIGEWLQSNGIALQAMRKGQRMVSTCSCRAIRAVQAEGVVEITGVCESEYIATGRYYQVVVRLSPTSILSGVCVCFSTLRGHGFCKHVSCLLHTILLLQQRPSTLPKWAKRSQRTVRMLKKASISQQNKHRLWDVDLMYEKFIELWPPQTVVLSTQQAHRKRGRPRAQARSEPSLRANPELPAAPAVGAVGVAPNNSPSPQRRILPARTNRGVRQRR